MNVLEAEIMTSQEFKKLTFSDEEGEFYYELIDGEIMKKQAPSPQHQRISKKILFSLETFVRTQKIGEVFSSPIDVFLSETTVVQPDVLFISNERNSIIDEKEGIIGAPDLVVEVISRNSVIRDRVSKKNIYEKSDILEYWIIDPQNAVVEIYAKENGQFVLFSALEDEGDVAKSKVMEGFTVSFEEVF
jgi:Uma2 family endonuclease